MDPTESSYSPEGTVVSEEDVTEFENEYDTAPPATPRHLNVLRKQFRIPTFKPLQWSVISTVLHDKRDQCVVMTTGYGKSLCYQYPSVFTGGITLVVSPLISLMTDQVQALNDLHIPATFLGSAQENSTDVCNELLQGQYRILYVTPEFVTGEGGASFLEQLHRNVRIDLMAIDEAHCVSKWGHDFRPTYGQLGHLRSSILSEVPILAVTATATPSVLDDICRSLGLVNPRLTITCVEILPNLHISVSPKMVQDEGLRSALIRDEDGLYSSTIIYCLKKNVTDRVHQVLTDQGVDCVRYHAGMDLDERNLAHENFVANRIRVIVATVAFSMGIDKPDVRLIIHYGAPSDMDFYYHGIGRAGRDGKASRCIVFWSLADFTNYRLSFSSKEDEAVRDNCLDMLRKMERYLSSTDCRKQQILTHFGTGAASSLFGTSGCCDNCEKSLESARGGGTGDDVGMKFGVKFDFGRDAKLFFSAIQSLKKACGLRAPGFLLTGSGDKRVSDEAKKSPFYGKGTYRSQKWWKAFGRMLLSAGYLTQRRLGDGFDAAIVISDSGHAWLGRNELSLELMPSHELFTLEKRVKPTVAGQRPTQDSPEENDAQEDVSPHAEVGDRTLSSGAGHRSGPARGRAKGRRKQNAATHSRDDQNAAY